MGKILEVEFVSIAQQTQLELIVRPVQMVTIGLNGCHQTTLNLVVPVTVTKLDLYMVFVSKIGRKLQKTCYLVPVIVNLATEVTNVNNVSWGILGIQIVYLVTAVYLAVKMKTHVWIHVFVRKMWKMTTVKFVSVDFSTCSIKIPKAVISVSVLEFQTTVSIHSLLIPRLLI